MEKQRTITADDFVIGDKEIYDAVSAAIEYVDRHPKNRFIVNRKSRYKEYIYNQYEGK